MWLPKSRLWPPFGRHLLEAARAVQHAALVLVLVLVLVLILVLVLVLVVTLVLVLGLVVLVVCNAPGC